MKTWRVELATGGKDLAETKIQRSIFQGDAQSPFQFIIAMMPLNHILKKCTANLLEKINHLVYMDDIKLPKIKKNWKLSYTQSEYIVRT